MVLFVLVLLASLAIGLLYVGRTYLAWTLPIALPLAWWGLSGPDSPWLFGVAAVPFALVALGLGLRPLRARLVSRSVLRAMKPLLPRLSDTEREALDAGTVWWEGELFSGRPRWRKLLDFRAQPLSETEREFLAGPVEQVCSMVSDWDVHQRDDLPPEVWRFLADNGFYGMIVPKEHGGLGFSAAAHSAVVTKLSSRSTALAVTVMVPNSLGPAELLLHYGTDEQKSRWLPRLATGEEIPCFALTEPNAGSDAGAVESSGVVCRGRWEGEEVLGIRLDWNKRYITLAPVATVIGLAFRLLDPERLLGGEVDLGITCALVPTSLEGVEIGDRHDPLGVPFMNGTTYGSGVFVPLDAIIGGRAMAGQGWRMLMQSLAAGRGISLPSMSTGAAELVTRTVGAYASVRKQFGIEIGRFEGIEERLAHIGGMTYLMDATRTLTAGSIDAGEKPSVLTAIAKCYLTESMREVVNDAMDVLGGAGIVRGPKNILANAYTGLPISITVEGANILTRSMIIFGNGAVRCHPTVREELAAAEANDVARFDRAFFGHVGLVFANFSRALLLGVTNGRLARAPVDSPLARYYGRFARLSAAFAFASDLAMGTLGGKLKFKESLTGRLADALSWMVLGSAALKRFHDEGNPERDLPYARWSCDLALYRAHAALAELVDNYPVRWVSWLLRAVVHPTGFLGPLGSTPRPPADRLSAAVARGLLFDGGAREHLTRDIYVPGPSEEGLGVLEDALEKASRAHAILGRIKDAARSGAIEKEPSETLARRAREAGIIDAAEEAALGAAETARDAAVAVDAFPAERKAADRPAPSRSESHAS